MSDRLSALDVSFFYLEGPTTPMHVGGVLIFEAPEAGFDYDRLVRLIRNRIAYVPRYRQRVRWVPGHLSNPVWVDDENFDVTYHVRRSALPRPGTEAQLRELVGRIMSRPLDVSKPLWEMYLVEGLEGGRFAILTKTHHAMVDGVSAVDIGQVILDATPEPRQSSTSAWRPAREPSDLELVAGALTDMVRSPAAVVDSVRRGLDDVRAVATRVGQQAVGVVSAALTVARPPSSSPLNAEIGVARRFGTAATSLADYKTIRTAHGGTVNDVVLAVVAGALRQWLQSRGETIDSSSTVRALVPVSLRSDEATSGGNQVAAYLVDLPVGEANPVLRLQRISYEMGQHKANGQMMGAQAIVALAGFSPPTLHSLGARVGNGLSRRVFNTVVTNVPGPQYALYAGGSHMLAAYPVVPLGRGQAVSFGITSYDGGVYFGLNADRDSMWDVDELADDLVGALTELLRTTRKKRSTATRVKSATRR
ncbi:MAG: wax ester/triacylglycerol synthase family O-acyltransferase [Actinomycetes bacterium]